jgi:hypothetical protein
MLMPDAALRTPGVRPNAMKLPKAFLASAFCSSLGVALCGCATPQAAAPATPNNQPELAGPTTSDGEPIGADRQAPGKKLEQGPALDSNQGVKPSATPPTEHK